MSVASTLKRVFSKIGGGLKDPKAIKIMKVVVPHIPIAGPVLALALGRVAEAEELFRKNPKSGESHKKPWVKHQLRKDFREIGVWEKRIDAIIEIALLILKAEAKVDKPKPKAKGAKVDKPKPKAKGKGEKGDEKPAEDKKPTPDDPPPSENPDKG